MMVVMVMMAPEETGRNDAHITVVMVVMMVVMLMVILRQLDRLLLRRTPGAAGVIRL